MGTGYGNFPRTLTKSGKDERAHRVYYERHKNPIPVELELDHLCAPYGGPRNCVNPDHLEPVMHVINSQRGAHAKLSIEIAERIRCEHTPYKVTALMLAEKYNITKHTVYAILHNKIWRV